MYFMYLHIQNKLYLKALVFTSKATIFSTEEIPVIA